jgi:deazaflavin-dependent oxidoreductase (nitroreductase family)
VVAAIAGTGEGEVSMAGRGGLQAAAGRTVMRVLVWLYRRTGGAVAGTMFGVPLLLLTTTGRRSGRPWTVPVMYHPDGDRLVVVASNGGRDRHPAWWLNLRASGRATVQLRRDTFAVTASEAEGETRERLWPLVVDRYDGYAKYAEKTDRRIPVVVLERAAG